jgi:hypothetical protein
MAAAMTGIIPAFIMFDLSTLNCIDPSAMILSFYVQIPYINHKGGGKSNPFMGAGNERYGGILIILPAKRTIH